MNWNKISIVAALIVFIMWVIILVTLGEDVEDAVDTPPPNMDKQEILDFSL